MFYCVFQGYLWMYEMLSNFKQLPAKPKKEEKKFPMDLNDSPKSAAYHRDYIVPIKSKAERKQLTAISWQVANPYVPTKW